MPCALCSSNDQELLWELPQLPITECYGSYDPEFEAYDQALMLCGQCGHVQLANQLPVDKLYTKNEYAYRTGQAVGTPKRVKSFVEFCYRSINADDISVVDIGGNDQSLLDAFEQNVAYKALVDPIRKDQDGESIDNIDIFGRFIEEMDLASDLSVPPNVVVCTHTLEHVANPQTFIEQLFKQCGPDTLYFFEVPCVESMVRECRFDAVFHQHIHYFSLASFARLINEAGGVLIDHAYNEQATLGGALMVAFRLASIEEGANKKLVDLDIQGFRELFKDNKQKFIAKMAAINELVSSTDKPLYGFGASLMLPSLLYHLDVAPTRFTAILDDDEQKQGWQYKNLNLSITSPKHIDVPANAEFMVTSVENTQPILKRLEDFSPASVLVPLVGS